MIKKVLLGALLAIGGAAYAQDIHFSQFSQAPLTVNPALAGTTVWIRAAMQYRTQWRAVTVPYKTFGASFDVKSKRRWIKVDRATEKYRQSGDNGFGWGFNVYNDRAGDGKMGTLQANGTLAYQIMMGPTSMLALGFQAGLLQRSINFDNLYWGTQYDPNSPTGYNTNLPPDKAIAGGDNNFLTYDISSGLIYTYKKNERYMRGNDQFDITLGASVFHVNQPKYSFLGTGERLYMRMVAHGHSIIGIKNTSMAVAPGFIFQRQGPNQEFLIGSMFRYMLKEDSKYTGYVKGSTISAGAFYRNQDALIIMALYEFSSYGIGVSYDLNTSSLKTASTGRGGLEITLRFLNPSPFIYSQASFNK